MAFVWSVWYLVLLFLVAAVVGLIVAFIMMDKQDKVLISNFIKENSAPAQEAKPVKVETVSKE